MVPGNRKDKSNDTTVEESHWWSQSRCEGNFPNGARFDKKVLMKISTCRLVSAGLLILSLSSRATAEKISDAELTGFKITSRQITQGPLTHFFGYIGHVGNVPWSGDGRYLLALRTPFLDHLPGAENPADVVLIDTENNHSSRVVDQCRAWNPQQGTMFYWNPDAPETQFFFNDRDQESGKVFTVLFDLSKGEHGKRVREYRFEDTPVGNGGVAQQGGYFLGINYARMARLRKVTGYAGATDWTEGIDHPTDDGVFRIDVGTGEQTLLVSFKKLAGILKATKKMESVPALFINHTLANRENDRIFFFARGGWDGNRGKRVNQGFVMKPDGTGLKPLKQHIGGHPEWDLGHRMIGHVDGKQVIYDVDRDEIVGQMGNPDIFPDPEGDVALSPDGKWFVNGFKNRKEAKNYYVIYRRADGAHFRTQGFNIGQWKSGDLRQDPSPRWNRSNDQILVPAVSPDGKSRQMNILTIHRDRAANEAPADATKQPGD